MYLRRVNSFGEELEDITAGYFMIFLDDMFGRFWEPCNLRARCDFGIWLNQLKDDNTLRLPGVSWCQSSFCQKLRDAVLTCANKNNPLSTNHPQRASHLQSFSIPCFLIIAEGTRYLYQRSLYGFAMALPPVFRHIYIPKAVNLWPSSFWIAPWVQAAAVIAPGQILWVSLIASFRIIHDHPA